MSNPKQNNQTVMSGHIEPKKRKNGISCNDCGEQDKIILYKSLFTGLVKCKECLQAS